MTHSTLWLAQLQFFSGLGFMLLFVALELGLAWALLFFRIKALTTGLAGWTDAYRFWVRVFALAFLLSFAAGLSALIQFGSLWPGLMAKIGDVAAPMLAAAIALTFVFKAGFLGAMLFGARRLSGRLHTVMVGSVALGSTLSAFFLLAVVSWTHTPSGAWLVNGHYIVIDAWQVLFNPALPWYGALFATTAGMIVAASMMAVVSGQAARNPAGPAYRLVFRTAMLTACVSGVLFLVAAGGTARLAAQYQPAKAAAVAGYWQSSTRPDFAVLAWPDAAAAANRGAWVWRGHGARLLASDDAGQWRGLDQFSGMNPPVALTFWSFRLMIVLAALTAILSAVTWLRLRRNHYDPAVLPPLWRRVITAAGYSSWLLPVCALAYIQLGAFPYAVYGTITLTEVLAPASAPALVFGNVLYALCYVALLIGFFMNLRYISRYGVVPVGRRRRT